MANEDTDTDKEVSLIWRALLRYQVLPSDYDSDQEAEEDEELRQRLVEKFE